MGSHQDCVTDKGWMVDAPADEGMLHDHNVRTYDDRAKITVEYGAV